jgi:hypothetical protein
VPGPPAEPRAQRRPGQRQIHGQRARLLMIMQNASGAAALLSDENGAGQQCVIAMITPHSQATSPGPAPFISSMTFRIWSSSPCSASLTGLWGELAAGSHAAASRSATARDPNRHKQGRIASGAAAACQPRRGLLPGTAGRRRSLTAWPTAGMMAPTPQPGSVTGWPWRATQHWKTCLPGSMTRRSPWPSGAPGIWSSAGWRCRLAGRSACPGRWHPTSSPGRREAPIDP